MRKGEHRWTRFSKGDSIALKSHIDIKSFGFNSFVTDVIRKKTREGEYIGAVDLKTSEGLNFGGDFGDALCRHSRNLLTEKRIEYFNV